jgi:hypothetical protein
MNRLRAPVELPLSKDVTITNPAWLEWYQVITTYYNDIFLWVDPASPNYGRAAPNNPFVGMLAFADGVNWNPSGRGFVGIFQWDGSAWLYIGGDVFGPDGSVDSDMVEFSGTAGIAIKDGGLKHVDVADAVAKKHFRFHVLNSTADHSSTIQATKVMIADANGLPAQGTNTDSQVVGAVKHKATEDAFVGLVLVETVGGAAVYSGVVGVSQALTVVTGVNFTASTVTTATLTITNGVITGVA